MRSKQEARLKSTLFHLIELFQSSGGALSPGTLAGIVQTLEGFRWDAKRIQPDSQIAEELELRLQQLEPADRRRFERFVREMLLQQIA